MPYNITRFNGTLVATVEDGTVDNTLDIKLVGKNYAGYGEIQNENAVHMLENFAGPSQPPRKITGQLWYDSLGKKLKFYDGTQFRTTGGAEVGNTQPSGLSQGDFWFNTSANQLYAWDGDEFILVGPQAVEGAGQTELRSESVIDNQNIARPIVKALVNNTPVFIISNNEFTLKSDSPLITDFPLIKKGITLNKTRASDGISQDSWQLWGTASSAKGILNTDGTLLTAANFVRSGNVVFPTVAKFNDPGYFLGDDNDIRFQIDNNVPVLTSNTDDAGIIFKSKLSSSTTAKTTVKFLGNDILPGLADVSKIGLSGQKFSEIYAGTFYGSLTGTASRADALLVEGGTYKGATADADADTIAVRDAQGKLTAVGFLGEASRAAAITGGTAQSLLIQTAANTTGFLPKGATGTVLNVSNTGNLAWVDITTLLPQNVAATTLNVQDNTDANNYFITFVTGSSGAQSFKVHSNGITYNPGSKTLTTDFFSGVAANAKYADLAEKYLADKEYEVGTVLMIGGDKEVTACTLGGRAIGVVSANPAYLMNSDLENGTAVALKGRVPVKVEGMIIKGQKLMAGSNGVAIHDYSSSFNAFAIALESSNDPNIKLIEALVL